MVFNNEEVNYIIEEVCDVDLFDIFNVGVFEVNSSIFLEIKLNDFIEFVILFIVLIVIRFENIGFVYLLIGLVINILMME